MTTLLAPQPEPKKTRAISIEDRLYKFAANIGHGNASLGIRHLLETAYQAQQKEVKDDEQSNTN